MANNTIGLSVDVKFPTQAELQRKLSGYKLSADFDLKASKESINKIKSQLEGLKVNLNIDTKSAKSKLATVNKKIKAIDTLLNKKRTMKIDVDIADFDKKLSSALAKMESNKLGDKISKPMATAINQSVKDMERGLKKIQGEADKVTKTIKKNKDGSISSNKTQGTTNNGNGSQTTTTYDSVTGKSEIKQINDKTKAVKEYGEQLKLVNKLEQELNNAKTKESKDSLRAVLKEEKKLRDGMAKDVEKHYGEGSLNGSSNLKETQKAIDLSNQKAKRQKEEKETLDKLNSSYKNYIAMLKKQSEIESKLVNAKGEEKKKLQTQSNQLAKGINTIQSKNDDFKGLDSSQKDNISNLKKELKAKQELVQAKKKDSDLSSEQKLKQENVNKAYKEYAKNLKEIEKLNKSIAKEEDGRSKNLLVARQNALMDSNKALANEHNNFRGVDRTSLNSDVSKIKSDNKVSQARDKEAQKQAEIVAKEKERKNIISEYTALKKKAMDYDAKSQVAKGKSEREELEKLRDIANGKAKNIKRSNNDFRNFNGVQKSEMNELLARYKQESGLKVNRQDDKVISDRENAKLVEAKNNLKDMYEIKKKIATIEARNSSQNGDSTNLRNLKEELRLKRDIANIQSSGLSSQSAKELSNAEEVYKATLKTHQAQEKRNQDIAKANSLLSQHSAISKEINRLQMQMVYSGDREKRIIQREISSNSQKLNSLRSQIDVNRDISNQQRRQLDNEKALQSQINKTNRARQKAREKDQVSNDQYGVVDFSQTANSFEQGFRTILDSMARVDEAYMRVAKVANESDEYMQNFKKSSFDVASSLGVTSDEYMNAVETWVTAGETMRRSQELADTSLMGSFVGNIDVKDMVKYMAVPMKAYEKTEGLSDKDIVNTMNEVSNTNAIEMTELGKAYQRSATSAETYGTSFSELTGMITGAQEVTRLGGERIGTAMKSMSINYGMIQAKNSKASEKKNKFFKGIGVDLEENSFYETLEGLEKVWKDLSTKEKATASFNLAGKDHANVMNGIISQWDTVEEAKQTSEEQYDQDNNGSAYQEFEKQKKSIRFKIAELKNTWDKFLNTIGDSNGAMGKVLDGLATGLQKVSDILTNDKLMNGIFALMGMVALHGATNGIKKVFDMLGNGFRRTMSDVTGLGRAMKDLKNTGEKGANGGTVARINGGLIRTGANNNIGKGNRTLSRNTPSSVISGRLLNTTPIVRRTTSSDGAIIRSVNTRNGSNVSSNRRNNDNDRNARNNSNDNDNDRNARNNLNSTTRDVQNLDNATGKASSSMKGLANVGKKAFGLIPILGDALIIAEMLGVPVFEKIGSAIKGTTKDQKELNKEINNMIKDGTSNNSITNGNVKGVANDKQALQKSYDKKTVKNKKYGNSMNSDDFDSFKKQFEKDADKIGVSIKLKYNDDNYIEKQMKKLKKAQINYTKTESKKSADKVIKSQDKKVEVKDNIEKKTKDLKQYKKVLKSLENRKKMNVDLGIDTSKDERNIKKYQKKINGTEKDIDSLKTSLKDIDVVSSQFGESLLKISKTDIKDVFKGMNKKEATTSIKAMSTELEVLKDNSKNTKKTLENLKLPKLDAKGFQEAKEQLSEIDGYDEKLNSISFQEFMNNTDGARDALMTFAEQSSISGDTAYSIGKKAMDGAIETMSAMGLSSSAIAEATGMTKKYVDQLLEIPSDATTTIYTKGKSEVDATLGSVDNLLSMNGKSASVSLKTTKTTVNEVINKITNLGSSPKNTGGRSSSVSSNDSVSSLGETGINTGISTGVANSSVSNSVASVSNNATSVSSATSSSKKNTNTKAKAKAKAKVNNTRVESDVWRYWKTEIQIEKLGASLNDLDGQVSDAGDNYAKANALYKKENRNLDATISANQRLKSSQEGQINSVLRSLRKYGFKTDTKTNTISNLGHAKSLKGTGAEKAQTLLDTYKGLMSSLIDTTQAIKDAKGKKKDNNDASKQNSIDDEAKGSNKASTKTTMFLNNLNRNSAYQQNRLSMVDDGDYEQKLKYTESAMNTSKTNITSLVGKFNELAKMQQQYPENAEIIKEAMTGIADTIKEESLAVVDYENSLKEIEMERFISDFDKFSEAVGRLDSNIVSLKTSVSGGLLSGTKLTDLQSASNNKLSFARKGKFTKAESEYSTLVKNVDALLDDYEKKNILKWKSYADEKIKISKDMYDDLAKLSYDYNVKTTKKTSSKVKTSTKKVTVNATKKAKKYKSLTAKEKKGKTTSQQLTALLKKNKLSTSKANKKKLASTYGIKNYTGTKAQDKQLISKIQNATKNVVKKEKVKKYTKNTKTNSLTSFMKSNKLSTSKANKKKLASTYGIKNYTGTKAQQSQLLKKLKSATKTVNKKATQVQTLTPVTNTKKVKKYTKNTKASSLNSFMKSNKLSTTKANKKKLASTYGIKNYTGTKAQDKQLLAKLKSATKTVKTTTKKAIKKTTSEKIKTNKYANKRDTTSLNSFLKANGMTTDAKKKTALAKALGIKNYTGTKAQDKELLKKLKAEKVTTTKKTTKYYNTSGKEITKAQYDKLYTKTTTTKTTTTGASKSSTTDTKTKTGTTTSKTTTSSKTKIASDVLEDILGSNYDIPKYLSSVYEKYNKVAQSLNSQYSTADLNKSLALNTKYLMATTQNQIDMQNALVTATQKAIEELEVAKKQSWMTTDDINEINDKIAEMQDSVIEAQAYAKELVAERFQYEFDFIDTALAKYSDYADDLEYTYGIIESMVGKNYKAKSKLMGEELSNQKAYSSELKKVIDEENKRKNSYAVGSFEWNTINTKVSEYKELLEDSNTTLMEMSKNLMSLDLSNAVESFQKLKLGKNLSDYADFTETWVTGVEKSLMLEQLHLKAKESEVDGFTDRINELSQQEKISRNEYSLIEKQIELEELRNKLAEISNEKDVQVLKQQANGTWDYEYESSEQQSELESQLLDKQLEIEQLKKQYLQDYMSKIENISSVAQEGGYENLDEMKNAINDVNNSFKNILDSDMLMKDNEMKDFLDIYSSYMDNLKTVGGSTLANVESYKSNGNVVDGGYISSYFNNSSTASKDNLLIGTGANLITDRYTSSISNSVMSKAINDSDTSSINIEKVEFPNANSSEDIKKALLDLPRYAKEQSTTK